MPRLPGQVWPGGEANMKPGDVPPGPWDPDAEQPVQSIVATPLGACWFMKPNM